MGMRSTESRTADRYGLILEFFSETPVPTQPDLWWKEAEKPINPVNRSDRPDHSWVVLFQGPLGMFQMYKQQWALACRFSIKKIKYRLPVPLEKSQPSALFKLMPHSNYTESNKATSETKAFKYVKRWHENGRMSNPLSELIGVLSILPPQTWPHGVRELVLQTGW